MKDKSIGLSISLMGGSELKDNLATKTPTTLSWAQFLAQKPKSV